MTSNKLHAARQLFLQESFGVLSTMSVDVPGYPFGSVTPYCVDRECQPIVFISAIAQHTRNIIANPKVSLTVVEANSDSDDVQARGRLTLLADARPVDRANEKEIRDRYLRYFPSAVQYEGTHDFGFYQLALVRARFIGGFGQIFWLTPEELCLKNPFSSQEESVIVGHMNKDHAAALALMAGTDAGLLTMTGIDAEGFDAIQSGRKRRFIFERPVRTMEEARQMLISMSRRPVAQTL